MKDIVWVVEMQEKNGDWHPWNIIPYIVTEQFANDFLADFKREYEGTKFEFRLARYVREEKGVEG